MVKETLVDSKAGRPNHLINQILKQEIAKAIGEIRKDHDDAIEQARSAERALVSSEMKAFRTEYANVAKLAFLDKETAKLGYGLVTPQDIIAICEGRPNKRANTGEKHTRSGSCSSRAPSPDPLTPPRSHLMDLEKTPTPTPIKGKKQYKGSGRPMSPLPPFLPTASPTLPMPIIAAREDITISQQLPIEHKNVRIHPVVSMDQFPDPLPLTAHPTTSKALSEP